ncbi:MAG: primosomal protein N' [Gammaproteobacteria bacterium]|nr:primosomal protein N' [Gammaproteobacteria bacterium]
MPDQTPMKTIAKIAVPAPLFGLFDYKISQQQQLSITPGCRVKIPFGRKSVTGVVVQTASHSDFPDSRLKAIEQLIDETPVLSAELLKLLEWAAGYYQHPLGDVIATALPKLLRQGLPPEVKGDTVWQLTEQGKTTTADELGRAPRQASLLTLLQQDRAALNSEQLNALSENWRPAMQGLVKKRLVETRELPCLMLADAARQPAPALNIEQQAAVAAVSQLFDQFHSFLLQGITGSGKTEVYLALVEQMIERGKQVLILVPEISLTPQLTRRFQQRLTVPIAAMHSGLNDRQRLCAWSMARENRTQVVIGTRSALFMPMPELGLIIIDEEHDGSLKQQEGFRYHARDLALVRARNNNIPILLGSATPSLETLNNANRGQYQQLHLTQRASNARPPRIHVLDVCRRPLEDGISDILLAQIQQHLKQDGQILLFLNRRGYAPLLMCHACGWTTDCPRCDAHMTLHHHSQRLQCHHCGHERAAPEQCPECSAEELYIPGAGTERIEQALNRHFPDTLISRIDRDTTRRKGALHDKLEQARTGEAKILIGTQMLAKGHDFPNVTLVGILDTDQGLFSADFRGTEHMAQLIVQVAGRAGRATKPGEVFIQTHHPEHPLLQTLLNQGYEGFARAALAERQTAQFPPFAYMTVLRCAAPQKQSSMQFLHDARSLLARLPTTGVEIFGPLPAPMERRAGRFRAQLILQSTERKALHNLLNQWVPQLSKLKMANRVRWSVDIDPQNMY